VVDDEDFTPSFYDVIDGAICEPKCDELVVQEWRSIRSADYFTNNLIYFIWLKHSFHGVNVAESMRTAPHPRENRGRIDRRQCNPQGRRLI
jgi:hypothetical protein